LIPKIAEAIGYGLKVIENSFEELDVNVGDSESEDDDDAVGRADKILKVKVGGIQVRQRDERSWVPYYLWYTQIFSCVRIDVKIMK
jgi:hypothetical protein